MMNAETGKYMEVRQHIHQSITDILFTRYGSRVQREQYGSIIPELIDSPLSAEALAMMIASGVYMALATYEPRIELNHVNVGFNTSDNPGLSISIDYKIGGTVDQFILKVRPWN